MRHWIQLIRLVNVLLSGAAALVGAYIAGGHAELTAWLLILVAPMLITAAGNIQNDYCDRSIDRLNRPDRPLISGAIHSSTAKYLVAVCYILGCAAAIPVGWTPLLIALLVVAILTLYNISWSRLPGLGNLTVASLGALPIFYGAFSVAASENPRMEITAAAALIALGLHLTRELLKDTVDMDGDRIGGRSTLPLLHGQVAVMRWSALVMIAVAAASLWLGTTGWLNPIYMVGTCITILPALLYGAAQCWWRPELTIAAFWSGGLKLIMVAGLVWITLGAPRP